MTSRAPADLDAPALAALVRLRAILERAVAEAEVRTEPSRHIALVALDGACEYAMRIAAHHCGISIKRDADFHACLGALDQLGGEWTRPGWRGVVELHSARNQAQHLGILSDPELMASWVQDARVFVGGLVQAAFRQSLADVMLADAVRNEDLRDLISRAEQSLHAGDAAAAVLLADSAFQQARRRWQERRHEAAGSVALKYTPSGIPDPWTLDGALDHLEVQVFAADMSRYTQLLTTRRHLDIGGPEPDEAEARNALMFAFDWILRWEVFEVGYPVDRYSEYWLTVGPPTLDEHDSPRVAWVYPPIVAGNSPAGEERYHLVVQLANLPERGRGSWGTDFLVALEQARVDLGIALQFVFYGIGHRGLLRIDVPAASDPDMVARLLNRAVDAATTLYEHREEQMTAARAESLRLAEAFSTAVQAASTGRDVFGDVEVSPELVDRGIRYRVRLPLISANARDANLAFGVFAGRGGALAGPSYEDDRVVFDSFPLEGDALERLQGAVRDAEDIIRHHRRADAEAELRRQEYARRIEDVLGRVPAEPAPTSDA
jgi:hypothetical protein